MGRLYITAGDVPGGRSRRTWPCSCRRCFLTRRACGKAQHTSRRRRIRRPCSPRMPMICSSVNLVRFIVRPQVGADSNRRWRKNPGADQTRSAALWHRGQRSVGCPCRPFSGKQSRRLFPDPRTASDLAPAQHVLGRRPQAVRSAFRQVASIMIVLRSVLSAARPTMFSQRIGPPQPIAMGEDCPAEDATIIDAGLAMALRKGGFWSLCWGAAQPAKIAHQSGLSATPESRQKTEINRCGA